MKRTRSHPTRMARWLPWSIMVMSVSAIAAEPSELPENWQRDWNQPPCAMRPLQIVHGHLFQANSSDDAAQTVAERIQALKQLGLGGIVCNVPFKDYMQSEQGWKLLKAGIDACRDLGMIVWLYDEEGYPSGAAGQLVLKENPEYESLELAYDAAKENPFVIRPSYEFTHANNNYYASRRYANLIDADAVRCFITKTHEAYWKRLQPAFGATIEAMFTDEPSLLAISLGQIPETARQRVRVVDPPNVDIKPLPAVPWCRDLPDRYRERYGEDLMAQRRSLFVGDGPNDHRVRRQFWSLIADLVAKRYFAALGEWCAAHHVASSGHSLHEESIMHHVPLEGNGLAVLQQMQIPGMDMLSSDPQTVKYSGWLTAAMPASAAALNGRRRLMTEVSDFQQKMGGKGPAGLAEMQATAAWQAAWGITDFTLYYAAGDRSAEEYRAYCRFVGRLNAILKSAEPVADVLLYYPIYDLWAEYRPVADRMTLQSQSDRARKIVLSFMQLGQMLQRNQISFRLIDHTALAQATAESGGVLAVEKKRYRAVLLPESAQLPPKAAAVVRQLQQQGGTVVRESSQERLRDPSAVRSVLKLDCWIDPPSADIVVGRFLRDGRRILVVANVSSKPYNGTLSGTTNATWLRLDPATGDIARTSQEPGNVVSLELAPRQTLLLAR